MIPGVKEPT